VSAGRRLFRICNLFGFDRSFPFETARLETP
jgi:hypothetical protein